MRQTSETGKRGDAVIVIDTDMPDNCFRCPCLDDHWGASCRITGQPADGKARPDTCPALEVEKRVIRKRVNSVNYADETLYVPSGKGGRP